MFEKWAFDGNFTIFSPWTDRESMSKVNTSIKLPSANTMPLSTLLPFVPMEIHSGQQ